MSRADILGRPGSGQSFIWAEMILALRFGALTQEQCQPRRLLLLLPILFSFCLSLSSLCPFFISFATSSLVLSSHHPFSFLCILCSDMRLRKTEWQRKRHFIICCSLIYWCLFPLYNVGFINGCLSLFSLLLFYVSEREWRAKKGNIEIHFVFPHKSSCWNCRFLSSMPKKVKLTFNDWQMQLP